MVINQNDFDLHFRAQTIDEQIEALHQQMQAFGFIITGYDK
jgi:hypothetical protein